MSLLDKILGAMTDNKGLLQGGEYGRSFGRIKDARGVAPSADVLQSDYETTTHYEVPPQIVGEQGPMPVPQEKKESPLSQAGNRLSYVVENFDPTNNDSVLDLQKSLNAAGFGLKEDGVFGAKTLKAVRDIQQGRDNTREKWGYEG